MEFLYGIVMTLIIGLMACIFASIVISKIGEEQRRNADYAMEQMGSIFKELPDLCMNTFKTVKAMEEQESKREAEEYEKKQATSKKDLFEGLDDDLVI